MSGASSIAGDLRVLFVEDSEDDALLLTRTMVKAGYKIVSHRVETAETLREALLNQLWDLVISDFQMPAFNGAAALAMVREMMPDLPFIAVSGTRGEDYVVKAMHDGATDFLVKTNLARLVPAVERALKEKAISRAKVELERQLAVAQKMEAVGRLAAGVAHDFNNLLVIINGHAQMAHAELKQRDPVMAGDILNILRAGERAADLTRRLLTFSRSKIAMVRVLKLNGAVSDMEKLLRRLIREDVTVKTVLCADPWPIEADPGNIDQVILNLVVNASDAMSNGGTLTIETANEIVDGVRFAVLKVVDTGTGMSPEVQARIFEPFFTTKEVGKGTGLGLPTIYGIVQSHGGSIEVQSAEGAGTTFTVRFPVTEKGAVPKDSRSEPVRGGSETILIVEDQPEVSRVAVRVLGNLGYRLMEARNGIEAVGLSDTELNKIDMLLTDVVMPHMNGTEVAERLRRRKPGLKVLFLSGHVADVTEGFGLDSAGLEFLRKPYAIEDLALRVRVILDRK